MRCEQDHNCARKDGDVRSAVRPSGLDSDAGKLADRLANAHDAIAEVAGAWASAALYRRGFRLYEQFRPSVPSAGVGAVVRGQAAARPISLRQDETMGGPRRFPVQASHRGSGSMAVHKLTMVRRPASQAWAANPVECSAHFFAGRLPVYLGRQLVAYADDPADLPQARFVERDGRLAGLLDVWDPPAELTAA
jgi:hypothetical protein